MIREVDINEISDGNKYTVNDMVRIACNDCRGCSKCCHDMGSSIVIDPLDIFMISKGLDKSFEELLSEEEASIELSMVDNLLLPNLKMQKATGGCAFLNDEGRCRIHSFRPGICRLFPLGRLYEDGGFTYFNQIHECSYPSKSKIKIKKWLGIDDLKNYECFILSWHDYLNDVREAIRDCNDPNMAGKIMTGLLKKFYKDAYDGDRSFYEQVFERMEV